MKNWKKIAAVVLSLATCSTLSIGIASAFDGSDQAFSAGLLSDSEFAYDDLYGLYAELTNVGKEPDFAEMTITVYRTNADGEMHTVMTDASLEEVKKQYHVEISSEPLDPTGIMYTITISAFSNALNETVSATVSFSDFGEPAESNLLTELRTEITKKPDDTVIHGFDPLDLTGMTISVYEIDVDGHEIQTFADASLDEVKEKYRVDVEIEDEAPGSGICIVTVWAYSDVYHSDISASDSFSVAYGAPLPEPTSEETEPSTEETEETTETDAPVPDDLLGDVNADGIFSVSDVILFQKWLLAVPDVHLNNWKAADFYPDDKLNIFDLCLMKNELIQQKQNKQIPYSVADQKLLMNNISEHEETEVHIALSFDELRSIMETAENADVPDGINETLFSDKAVIVVYTNATASNTYTIIDHIERKQENLTVSSITRTPMVAYPDMAYRRFILVVNQEDVQGITSVETIDASTSYDMDEEESVYQWFKEWIDT